MEENASEELLPGIEVSDRLLKELSPEKHDKIEDLTVGYTWKESEEADQVIYFIPDWYVLYDGVWIEFESLLEIQGEVAYGFYKNRPNIYSNVWFIKYLSYCKYFWATRYSIYLL